MTRLCNAPSRKVHPQIRQAMFALLATFLIGCAPVNRWINEGSAPPIQPAGPTAQAVCYDNPTFLPVTNYRLVWHTTVSVLGKHFDRFQREQPVRQIGGVLTEGRIDTAAQISATIFEPWRSDVGTYEERVENTLQTMRRWAVVRIVPAGHGDDTSGAVTGLSGFWVSVAVYRELEDVHGNTEPSAGEDTFRYDDSMNRVADPIGEVQTAPRWQPMGRDMALEQIILQQVHQRLGIAAACPNPMDFRGQSPEILDPPTGSAGSGSAVPLHTITSGKMDPASTFVSADALRTAYDGANESPGNQPLLPPGDRFIAAPTASPPLDLERPSLGFIDRCMIQGAEASDQFDATFAPVATELCTDVCLDHQNFYGCENLGLFALGIGVGAVLANTSLDGDFDNWWQNDVRSQETNNLSSFFRPIGDGRYILSGLVVIAVVGHCLSRQDWTIAGVMDHWSEERIAQHRARRYVLLGITAWSCQTLRAAAVGAPPLLLSQWALGAARPDTRPYGSQWKPFTDTNAVSGHAFIGALPFITAAKMSHRPIMKITFYALSALPAWSRVNDQRHYLSQALLGWWFAYLSCDSVAKTELTKKNWLLTPSAEGCDSGMTLTYQW